MFTCSRWALLMKIARWHHSTQRTHLDETEETHMLGLWSHWFGGGAGGWGSWCNEGKMAESHMKKGLLWEQNSPIHKQDVPEVTVRWQHPVCWRQASLRQEQKEEATNGYFMYFNYTNLIVLDHLSVSEWSWVVLHPTSSKMILQTQISKDNKPNIYRHGRMIY